MVFRCASTSYIYSYDLIRKNKNVFQRSITVVFQTSINIFLCPVLNICQGLMNQSVNTKTLRGIFVELEIESEGISG